MFTVDPAEVARLRGWFTPERPGPLIYEHVARTGVGRCRVDRLDAPGLVTAELPGGNLALRGDPALLPDGSLDGVAGFVEAPIDWLPALRAVDPAVATWQRVLATLPPAVAVPAGAARLLGPEDAAALAAFEADGAWSTPRGAGRRRWPRRGRPAAWSSTAGWSPSLCRSPSAACSRTSGSWPLRRVRVGAGRRHPRPRSGPELVDLARQRGEPRRRRPGSGSSRPAPTCTPGVARG